MAGVLLSLGKVDVVVYMILTEAVIPGAAGAVAKLKIGIIRISPAADGALVVVKLLGLLPADTL